MVKSGIILSHLILKDLLICESYIEGKMTKRPFIAKGYRAKGCLELGHINVCGPLNVHTWESYDYFIMFIDDYFRFRYVYLMHRKSNALDKFIEFKVELKNLLGKNIKTL